MQLLTLLLTDCATDLLTSILVSYKSTQILYT